MIPPLTGRNHSNFFCHSCNHSQSHFSEYSDWSDQMISGSFGFSLATITGLRPAPPLSAPRPQAVNQSNLYRQSRQAIFLPLPRYCYEKIFPRPVGRLLEP